MNNKFALLSILLVGLSACGSSASSSQIISSFTPSSITPESSSIISPSSKAKEERLPDPGTAMFRSSYSMVGDPNFKRGFNLTNTNPSAAKSVGKLDHNGEAIDTPTWKMAQWWAPDNEWSSQNKSEYVKDPEQKYEGFNLKDASCEKSGNTIYHYETESKNKIVEIDTEKGSITLECDTGKDYGAMYTDTYNYGAALYWSHLLFEQSFPGRAKYVSDLAECHITFDFTLNKKEYVGKETENQDQCASFYIYTTLTNSPHGEYSGSGYGTAGKYMWVGLPLFDTRYNTVPPYYHLDDGHAGNTGNFIYSTSSNSYFRDSPLEVGKKYHVDFDLMDLFQEAFVFGVQEVTYMKNMVWNNMSFGYFNLGWEIPGAWNVSATMSQLDVYYIEK